MTPITTSLSTAPGQLAAANTYDLDTPENFLNVFVFGTIGLVTGIHQYYLTTQSDYWSHAGCVVTISLIEYMSAHAYMVSGKLFLSLGIRG